MKNQGKLHLENRRSSPCLIFFPYSPCSPNLLSVLQSEIAGFYDLQSPAHYYCQDHKFIKVLSSPYYLPIIILISILIVLLEINVITTTCQVAHDDNVSEMGGPRGLAALLFFLGLSSQVSARQEVILVKGTDGSDGLYVDEGQGSSAYYKRLEGANSGGTYHSLLHTPYSVTERQGTWVLGWGGNSGGGIGSYRAPAGSAGEDAPPEIGWQLFFF